MKNKLILFVVISIVVSVSCSSQTSEEEVRENNYKGCITIPLTCKPTCEEYVAEKLKSYAPVELKCDLSHLTSHERKMIDIFRQVGDIIDDIYWKQTFGQKDLFLNSFTDENAKKYAMINYGPWDRLNDNVSFVDSIFSKPTGANFYPPDMTKDEFTAYTNPDKTSGYTILRRDKDGKLKCIWYHDIYKSELTKIAKLLREAAKYSDNVDFSNYLKLRADALLTSNYQPSDYAWMKVKDSNVDIVVGPIENYEDGLFGYKCSFEMFILVKDVEWSAKLSKFVAMLPELQAGLPVDAEYKKEVPGTKSDINVYDAISYRGDCNAGGKTIAINLPNDEEVQLAYGSRKFQLENSMKAKFDKIMVPIAQQVIDESQLSHLTFDAFFENTTFHEVAHGLGIKNTIDGKYTVREALKEQYSTIEESKADILGLYLVSKLYEKGEITSGELMDNYVTFLAGIFRSCRFGAAEAHGKANMLRFNYFEKTGAFYRNPQTGKYLINFDKMYSAMIGSIQQILTIQGDGNYDAAKKLVETDGVISPILQKDIDRINDANIPIDIIFIQ